MLQYLHLTGAGAKWRGNGSPGWTHAPKTNRHSHLVMRLAETCSSLPPLAFLFYVAQGYFLFLGSHSPLGMRRKPWSPSPGTSPNAQLYTLCLMEGRGSQTPARTYLVFGHSSWSLPCAESSVSHSGFSLSPSQLLPGEAESYVTDHLGEWAI